MVDVKQAVENAKTFVQDVVGKTEIRRLTLEEVQLSEDGKNWLVTLGLALSDPFDLLSSTTAPEKSLKIFKIDAGTGEVHSMMAADR
jgi:hypothetical protein